MKPQRMLEIAVDAIAAAGVGNLIVANLPKGGNLIEDPTLFLVASVASVGWFAFKWVWPKVIAR